MTEGGACAERGPGAAAELAKGDIVCHARHGVGVVLVSGQFCTTRFLHGKGPFDQRDLTLLQSADGAQQFLAETDKTGKIGGELLRGVSLWLRSDSSQLQAVAVALISPTRDPKVIELVEDVLATFPMGRRSRASGQLSAARSLRGLESWPDTVRAVNDERWARRLQEEELEAAALASREQARRDAELDAAVSSQIAIVTAIRSRLGRPSPTPDELVRVENAVRASIANPLAYSNVCWKCHTPVHDSFNPPCSACGWLVCICGGCRAPWFIDRQGRSGPCPMEADLVGLP